MAWSAATRAQPGRAHDDRQDDLTDAERVLIASLIPTQGRMGRPRATDPRRDPVPAVVGVPVAAQAALSSAVFHGSERFRDTGVPERTPEALRGPGAGAGRHHRQSVGEDDGKRRAFGVRCRQEDQGTEAAHRGGRGRQPDRGAWAPRRRAALAMLCRNFDLEPVMPADEVREHMAFTMMPAGLKARLGRRPAG